jgi:hypothetical protein
MKVEFSTEEFEFSHGRKPRGTGHWLFEITGPVVSAHHLVRREYHDLSRALGMKVDNTGVSVAVARRGFSGTLTEAKAEARADIRDRVGSRLFPEVNGSFYVTLLP